MNNKTPKISVVLPCYNGANMLPTAIDSCINQTFIDWELIIVNDCSTDKTLEIARKYEQQDNRIRIVDNETNLKLPASLNRGFSEAKGVYYTWTSDDNIMHPTMLKELSDYLDNHPDVGLVASDYLVIDENDADKRKVELPDNLQDMLPLNNYLGCSFMYRSEVAQSVGGYNEQLFLVEDYDYWLRICFQYPVERVNKVLYSYREHAQSLTSTRKSEIIERLVTMRLNYVEKVETLMSDNPTLLSLYYFRIVDNLVGQKQKHYIWRFTIKQPVYFGCRYFFIHLPKRIFNGVFHVSLM